MVTKYYGYTWLQNLQIIIVELLFHISSMLGRLIFMQASEIRRVNNLYRDQDFFALKTVKVPVKEHSVLTEPKMREKCRKNRVEERTTCTSGNTSSGAASDEHRLGGPTAYYKSGDEEEEEGRGQSSSGDADDEVGDSDGPEVRGVSIQSALRWKHNRHALLEKFDRDLQRIRESTEQQMSQNVRHSAISIDMPAFHPIVAKEQTYESRFLSDWRYSLILVGILILITIFIVVILILYRLGGKGSSGDHPTLGPKQ